MLAPGQDLVRIGRILKANGTDGTVVLNLHELDPDEINLEEPVFIYFDGSPVPFFVEDYSPKGGKLLVRLTDVRNAADAGEVIGKDVFMEEGSLSDDEEGDDMSFLCGWTLYDYSGNPYPGNPDDSSAGSSAANNSHAGLSAVKVGVISDFIDIPGNPCIEVDTKNGTALLPLHEDLIESLDPDARTITMNIPAGLL